MKKRFQFLTILLCLLSYQMNAQEISRKGRNVMVGDSTYHHLKMESVFQRLPLGDEYYSKHQIMFKRKYFKRYAGCILLGVGGLIGYATIYSVDNDHLLFHERFAKALPVALFGVTGGILVLSSLDSSYKYIDKAIDVYNEHYIESKASSYLLLSLTTNGYGLVYHF